MKVLYDINALALDSNGKLTRLFVSHPVYTIKECDMQVDIWKDSGYNLVVSWVQAKYEQGSTKTVHLKEYNWYKEKS